ncbi:hypothetical protein FA15DRAFT_664298 [Coprinopsis marcescibilis]|uniref:Nucleoporin NSP1 n=1 Tax=Coprinopsis marcescibilis TaxID=230819 RepID=A0A5C3L960_COPMA|nr:hypothetical protein FA15DRAFT_664298 [Coprinopsis marcescibilis]
MSFFGGTNPSAGGGLFGNTANTNAAGTAGSGLFGNAQSNAGQGPAKPVFGATGNAFGSSTNTNTGGGLFGGASTAPSPGGLFGGGSGAPSSAPSGNISPMFGSSASTTNNAAAPSAPGGLFGSSTQPNSTGSETTANKPASGLFSQPPSTGTTPALSGGLFGKPADATSSSQPPPPPSGLFGTKPVGTSGTPVPPMPSFSLGGDKGANPATGFSLGGSSTATSSGGLFGTKPAEKPEGATAAPPVAGFSLFGGPKAEVPKAPESNANKTPTATGPAPATSNAVVAVPPPSMLRGKTIEEIVNRWTTELETHVKDFSKFAGEVAVWDRALIENGNNLAALYNHVLAAERQQNEIDQTLDHVEQQQKDLLNTLSTYEKVTHEIVGAQGGSARVLDTGPADTERDRNYMLASDLHTNLDDLSTSLAQMIDSVNALSLSQKSSTDGADDPMAQISQILSSHLESLQWIDTAVRDVGSKVGEVEKRVKDSGQSNGSGQRQRGFGLNR